MGTLRGRGYGPLSDSSAKSKLTGTRRCLRDTVRYGIPNGAPSMVPEPKSACAPREAPTAATIAPEFDSLGSLSTGWFHWLERGKTGQWGAPARGRAGAVAPAP